MLVLVQGEKENYRRKKGEEGGTESRGFYK